MSILDNAIAWLSPRRGYEREAWRQAYDCLRGYDAAGHDRLNRNWNVHNESADVTDRMSRDALRARARDLEQNSDLAQSILFAYKRNVVGRGFTLRAQTGDDGLNNEIERAWKRWTKARNCSVAGDQSFNSILRMLVTRKRVDGGILVLFRYTYGGVVPFKLQLMEVDELDAMSTEPRHEGNTVVSGVEYDPFHRPVGYYFRQYDLDGWTQLDPVYVDAKDVFFYKSKRRPSQLREISEMATSITRIRDFNEHVVAVSVKERIAACLAILVKKSVPTGGLGRIGGAKEKDGSVDYSGKKLAPGLIMEMGAGDEAQIVDPKSTATDATAFLRTMQGLIASGQGLSYEAVSRDLTKASYSSARQGAIEDECSYAEEVEMLNELMSEIYERFVISGVLTGLFRLPDFWEKKEVYLNHSWIKAPKPWIDPAREANADKTALQSGQKTFQDLCAERGKDWQDAVKEMAEVLEYGRECGIEMGGVIFGNNAAGEPRGKK